MEKRLRRASQTHRELAQRRALLGWEGFVSLARFKAHLARGAFGLPGALSGEMLSPANESHPACYEGQSCNAPSEPATAAACSATTVAPKTGPYIAFFSPR